MRKCGRQALWIYCYQPRSLLFRLGQGDSIGAPAGGRLAEETQLAAKDKEKRRLDVEILKLRVESMKNLPLSQAEAEVKQRRLQELQAALHLVTSGIRVLKQPL